ncbi:hypothetical protein [Persicitalea sp.]|uniref:hypothetical protein n=1 Tax=Persicitalea sp. TaxID=3100273 RepID=UPI0035937B26
MKKVLFLLLAIIAVAGLGSCVKEDAPSGVGYPPLSGTWKLVKKNVPNDSSFTTKTIDTTIPQTLTFESDGRLSSMGEETSYYRSSRAYRVDSIRRVQQIGFLQGSVYVAFYQNFSLKNDSLTLIPCPSRECDLIFTKSR